LHAPTEISTNLSAEEEATIRLPEKKQKPNRAKSVPATSSKQ
jgi:hypothetical protein